MPAPGVYRFICPDGRSYVGAVKNCRKRAKKGIARLNHRLAAAFEQYPPKDWTFEILEWLKPGCSNDQLRKAEQRHIDRLQSWLPDVGFNIRRVQKRKIFRRKQASRCMKRHNKHERRKPETFHFDRRASRILDTIKGPDDEDLTGREVVAILDVSFQWLQIGRTIGYGPTGKNISPHCVMYPRGNVRKFLRQRAKAWEQRQWEKKHGRKPRPKNHPTGKSEQSRVARVP
jgi:hypothetical protein